MGSEVFLKSNVYWLADRLKGSPVRKHFADIACILKNRENGDQRIKVHLENLLSHTSENSTYYKNYKGCSLSDFPVMNKHLYIENYERIFIKQVWDLNPGWIAKTSGSTGIPFTVHQDQNKRSRVIAELKYFGEESGYHSHERMAQLRIWRNREKTKLWSFAENIFCFDVTKLNTSAMQNLVELLVKKKIRVLYSYPNALEALTDYININKISTEQFKIKTVIAVGEALLDRTSQNLAELFNCKVVKRYSNNENGVFGQSPLDCNFYLLNNASYVIEILRLNTDEHCDFGEPGRIVVTDLFNYAFPMIRSDTGDIGISGKGFSISHERPVLTEIYGRKLDVIYDTAGAPVNPLAIWVSIGKLKGVKQWQFIQKSRNSYILRFVIHSDLNVTFTGLKEVLGADALILTEEVDEIISLASGKRRFIINEYNS